MKRLASAVALSTLLAVALGGQSPPVVEALDGVDTVVLLQQGKEVFGRSALAVERGRFRYLFSSPETKAEFERDPARYEIQLGGQCARMGGTAGGNPSDYAVHDGRIYIFGTDECRKRFVAAPHKFLVAPPPPLPDSPAAAAEGRRVLDRLAKAIGGRQVEELTSYAETTSHVQRRGDAEVTTSMRTIWRFPNEVRRERQLSMPNREPAVLATVLVPGGAWSGMHDRTFPVFDFGLPSLEQDLFRHPLAILKARGQPDFKAAALAPATVGGAAVERVRVRKGGLDVTVAIAAETGRLHSIEFTDRNVDSELGTYTILYSDFRDEGGILLPRSARALFNGQPDAFLSFTVQTVDLNPRIDPALFTRPPSPGR